MALQKLHCVWAESVWSSFRMAVCFFFFFNLYIPRQIQTQGYEPCVSVVSSVFFANWAQLFFNLVTALIDNQEFQQDQLPYCSLQMLFCHLRAISTQKEDEVWNGSWKPSTLNKKVCESMRNKQCVLCKAGILRHDTIVPDSSRGKSHTTGVELNYFLGLHHMFSVFTNRKSLTQYRLFC